MKHLSIAALETAVWIARLGSFTAAAERLHTTQPAISTRVRELESALGIKLFVRAVRGVELTMEGREFIAKAQPLLQHLHELSASVNSTGALRGTVRIGAGNICMDWFPAMVLALRASLPKVTYDVELGLGGRMLQRLEARKLDLAIVSGPVDVTKFESSSLGFDRMVWVTTPALLRQFGKGDTQAFLQRVPLWCMQRDSFYWDDAIGALGEPDAGVELNNIDNMAAAAQIVRSGAGAALLSETLIKDDLASGRLVAVPHLAAGKPVEFSIVWSKGDQHPVLAKIVDAAQRASSFARDAQAISKDDASG